MLILGYIGAVLLGMSYFFHYRKLLLVQGVASACLLVYALSISAYPYVGLNAFCLVMVVTRLRRSHG